MSQIISFLLSLFLILQACPFGTNAGREYLTMLDNLSRENLRFNGSVTIPYNNEILEIGILGESGEDSSVVKVVIPSESDAENIEVSVVRNKDGLFAETDAFIDALAEVSFLVESDEAYKIAFEKMHDKISPEYIKLSGTDTTNTLSMSEELREIFRDFNQDIVIKNGNEYVLEFNNENSRVILTNLVNYIEVHKDAIVKFIDEYKINVFDGNTADGLNGYLTDVKSLIDSTESYPQIKLSIKETVNGYKIDGLVKYTSNNVENEIRGNFSFGKIKDVRNPEISTVIDLELFEKSLHDLYIDEYNANKAIIVWDNDNGYSSVRYINEEKNYTSMTYAEALYHKDGSVYVPLRKVAETFNETIGWDSEEGFAYILKNGWECRINGVIINGATYCPVREFEKIGYKVTFDSFNLEGDSRKVIMIYKG